MGTSPSSYIQVPPPRVLLFLILHKMQCTIHQSLLSHKLVSELWGFNEGGGGDSLIKVSTDVRRVQNVGRAKFPKKVPKKLMTGQVFMNLRVPNWKFSASRSLFHSFIEYYTSFVNNCPKPNARAKTEP